MKKCTVPISAEVRAAVDRAILATSPTNRIASLPPILDDLGVSRRDYQAKRLITRAMHERGAEYFTRTRKGCGGSYLVPDAVREAVAEGMEAAA